MRGASALQDVLGQVKEKDVRVFVVWEPVIVSDVAPPINRVLSRIPDPRVTQYYDKSRLLSSLLVKNARENKGFLLHGEELDADAVIWDCVFAFPPGARWEEDPPRPSFSGCTVVEAADALRAALSAHPTS
ncbi:MAG TPA: hypothetical protein VGR67_07180 [Candidatus Polarisedimenticolia bacterium]|nr:hypothetical protein [Candidatus Polarisedimenticolia bacterium]